MADDNLHKGADPKLFCYARQNRKDLTAAEKILWLHLRDRRLEGFKFRRQHPIADFIADFFCLECNLVVEVDGGYHTEKEQQQYDEGRTYELKELKIKVIRFTNNEVIEDTLSVLNEIKRHLKDKRGRGVANRSF
jgi:very-short-patch-repair endonuclease